MIYYVMASVYSMILPFVLLMTGVIRYRTPSVICIGCSFLLMSTIKNADLICVLQHGDIVEQGTHEELLSLGGVYAELYNSQFEEDGVEDE